MSRGVALGVGLLLACATSGDSPESRDEAATAGAEARSSGVLLRDGFVMTAAGPTLEHADVWIRDGKIRDVGVDLPLPSGVPVIELRGRWVTPGLIDPHTHIGVYSLPLVKAHADGNETSGAFQPAVHAEEAFWPQDPVIERALAGGVTTIHVLPGSANLVGGQGATLRLKPGLSARSMRFPDAPATMKMACGENPKRVYGKKGGPSTRMGEVALLRKELEAARVYEPDKDEKGKKAADHGKAALAAVLDGKILIQNHCYRADEMLLRLDLFREFDVKPRAFHHAVEAYKIRDTLAAEDVGAVVWADWWGVKMELLDAVPASAALLDSAGARVALHSDSPVDVQILNQQAAVALAAGLRAGIQVDRDRAIRWVTANPAWVLGIEKQVGTLEPDKEADLVVWSEDPFSVYAQADLVFIAGEPVYDRAHPRAHPLSDFELGIRKAP